MNRGTVIWSVVAIVIVGFGFYEARAILNRVRQDELESSCTSNLLNATRSSLLYASDQDDKLPPVFVFSESPNEQTKAYETVMATYIASEKPRCPADSLIHTGHEFGYVHCRSLVAWIPGYASGKRILELDIKGLDESQTPFMRDPVRGSETETVDGTRRSILTSPHGQYFNIGYLDGHAKHKKQLDMNKEF